MIGPSGGRRPNNWRGQVPHFRPISPPKSTRPRSVNWSQIGVPRVSGRSGNWLTWRWMGGQLHVGRKRDLSQILRASERERYNSR